MENRMRPLEAVPAIRRIDTDRLDIFAVEITGEVSASDVENLYGLLEGAYQLRNRLNLLVRLVDCEGIAWGEVADDTARSVHNHAMEHLHRVAIVSDEDSASDAIASLLDLGEPVDWRRFAIEDEANAWAWVEEDIPARS
jgi:hypothetical protein